MIVAENIQTIEVAGRIYPRKAKLVAAKSHQFKGVERWSIDDTIACLSGFPGYQYFMQTGRGCDPYTTFEIEAWAVEAAGRMALAELITQTCFHCEGEGKFICRSCGGTGGESSVCDLCDGAGETTCLICEGEGLVIDEEACR